MNLVAVSPNRSIRDNAWWRRGIFYEIAPISFQDSNDDGQGDLPGLMRRLDYLEWLGINVVWLTPIYPSPMLDLGYDIADYCAIDPIYGTLADFDALVAALHARDIRVILDLVPNHTSDRHPWFVESRSSRDNPKHDWYIWADPAANGGPPNNWLSRFGGSSWTWDSAREQYYHHSFLTEQPDLNWHNDQVRAAMADVMRFWLRRGVDGFRVDASAVVIKDPLLRDNPPNPNYDEAMPPPQRLTPVFSDDRPEAMKCLEDMRKVIDEFDDRVLAGEVQGKTDRIGHFYGNSKPRMHLPLNFALLECPWDALSLQAAIDAYFNALPDGAWPDWVIGGHDKPRVADQLGQARARVLAMLLLTLKGTPFLFAGDEIGMEQVKIPEERIRDPFEKLVGGYGLNRDPERSPMRWDGTPHGGFSSADPWLPMGDPAGRNVARQQADQKSILSLYRLLITLRRSEIALSLGDQQPLRSKNDVLSYKRLLGDSEILIALNFSRDPRRWDWAGKGTLLLSTHLDRSESAVSSPIVLRGDEGVMVRLSRPSR
jgi:alpha-glucosidase